MLHLLGLLPSTHNQLAVLVAQWLEGGEEQTIIDNTYTMVAVQRGNAASVMGTMDSQTLSIETLEL